MNADWNEPLEERVVSLAAACDEAVAAGATPADLDGMPTPPELRLRLQRGLACAQLLRQFWSTPDPIADTAAPSAADFLSVHNSSTRQLGRFQIRRELGRGGFGVVYLAFDPRLGREVALKLPQAQALLMPELRQRFAQEARAAAGLDHPNLVPVYEAGEVGPVCYIASAYCPGITLAAWLKHRAEPVPSAEAAALAATLAEAVQHAHSRGVLHRDLKPANILLQPDEKEQPSSNSSFILHPSSFTAKITDFGLAKLLESEAEAAAPGFPTRTGAVLGTPSYMAPEQAAGKHATIGPAADVYALGAILYEVLTGRPPFHGETPLDTLEQARSQEPLPPSRLRPRLTRDLETICLKCLEKEPSKRYASAGDLASDLRRFVAGEPIRARPVMAWRRAVKWAKRRPAAAVLLAVCVLLATVAFPGVTWLWLEKSAALANEEKERRRAEANSAATLVALADRDWLANHVDQARLHLDEIPPNYRDQRWHYLHRACHAELLSLDGPANAVRALAWSPDNQRLATTFRNNSIFVLDAATGKELLRFSRVGKGIDRLVFSQIGEYLIAATWRPDLPASKDLGGEVIVWNAATLAEVNRFAFKSICSADFSPDGRRVAVSRQKDVIVFDVFTGEELRRLRFDSDVLTMAFTYDCRRLACAEQSSAISTWDLVGGKRLQTFRAHPSTISHLAFSPDGRRLAAGMLDRETGLDQVHIWDLSAEHEVHTLNESTAADHGAVFHPSGRYLAWGSGDRAVIIWDTVIGREVLTLRGHSGKIFNLAFSPDGRRLASAGDDGMVKVWDTSSLAAAP